jgi:hypothetical protein
MPYIKRVQSIVNQADACGAGMKKAGLAGTMGWARIPNKIFKSNTVQKVPTFQLTCCSAVRSGVSGYTHIYNHRIN